MTKKQQLTKLLTAERYLKKTQVGYTPTGPNWQIGMKKLWEVRLDLGNTTNGKALSEAHGLLKKTEVGYTATAPRWKSAIKLIDSVEQDLQGSGVPNLGPVVLGEKSLLLCFLTHETAGLYKRTGSHYPAVDTGWTAGERVIAPESLIVTRQSSARGADAFYATGKSGLKYWIGHINKAPATGTKFLKGEVMCRIAIIPGADHLHWGIDARGLVHRDLRWGRRGNGPDYTYGSPTVGQQLAALLAA